MNTYTTRSEGFTDLIELFLSTISNGEIPPYLREKMHILFTGKIDIPDLLFQNPKVQYNLYSENTQGK